MLYKAIAALETVASIVTPSSSKQKNDSRVARFLQGNVLGLVAELTDVINNLVSRNISLTEQRRCIGAMELMIKLCGSRARMGRLQVSHNSHDVCYKYSKSNT